jgi:hypothetical protein
MRNGRGTYAYANGDKYVGGYRNDKRNGQGIQKFVNGETYVGGFIDDTYNGEGTYYFANGSIMSSGTWVDGKLAGGVVDHATIRMEKSGGVYVVPVRFNEIITLNAVVDSGVSIGAQI